MGTTAYEKDFYGWTQEQAALLRNRQWAGVDWENLIEEVEAMGRAQREALRSRLRVLLAHLLEWCFQADYPYRRSWRLTIKNQRDELALLLDENPSLRPKVTDTIETAYRLALRDAARETGFEEEMFPATCPWTATQVVDLEFWPEAGRVSAGSADGSP